MIHLPLPLRVANTAAPRRPTAHHDLPEFDGGGAGPRLSVVDWAAVAAAMVGSEAAEAGARR